MLSLSDVTIPDSLGNEHLRQRVCALQGSSNGTNFQTLGAITVNDLRAVWNTRSSDTMRVVQRVAQFRVPAVGHVRFSVEPFLFKNPDHVVLIEEITLTDTSSTRLAKSGSHEVLPQGLSSSVEESLPLTYGLHQNYPNPFNPSTQINFDLPEAGNVSLVIYDVLGREVAKLVDSYHEAGYHSVTWNASSFASGVYLARFVARQIEGGRATDAKGSLRFSTTQKLVLTK